MNEIRKKKKEIIKEITVCEKCGNKDVKLYKTFNGTPSIYECSCGYQGERKWKKEENND